MSHGAQVQPRDLTQIPEPRLTERGGAGCRHCRYPMSMMEIEAAAIAGHAPVSDDSHASIVGLNRPSAVRIAPRERLEAQTRSSDTSSLRRQDAAIEEPNVGARSGSHVAASRLTAEAAQVRRD